MELEPIEFQEVAEEVGWRHAQIPFHVILEHQNL
jgi:hypothetical protein